MKKITSKTKLIMRVSGAALIVCLFLLNSKYYVNLSGSHGDVSLSTLTASADGGETTGNYIVISVPNTTTNCANCMCTQTTVTRTTCSGGGNSACSPGTTTFTGTPFKDPQCGSL